MLQSTGRSVSHISFAPPIYVAVMAARNSPLSCLNRLRDDAAIRADALRSEVKRLRLQYKKQTLGQLTLSVGVAAFPEHALSSDELLKIADQCLYESKARGRDVVTVALPQNA